MSVKNKVFPFKRSDFLKVKERGSSYFLTHWFLIKVLITPLEKAEVENEKIFLGINLNKKVGNAVLRNRLRRWIKESFREEIEEFKGIKRDIKINIIFIRENKEFYKKIKHSEISRYVKKGIKKICNLAERNK